MCITNNLQKHIRNLTNDGEVVARFLVDTLQGNTPGAKPCHQLEAMKHIVRFGFTEDDEPRFWGLIPTPEELASTQPSVGASVRRTPSSPPSMSESVTHLDILNYDIAHLIRTETADGHTIAEIPVRRNNTPRQAIHPEETPYPPR